MKWLQQLQPHRVILRFLGLFQRLFALRRYLPRLSRRRVLALSALTFATGSFALVMPRLYSALQARSFIYTLETVPERPVAIVYGARIYEDGRLSAMLADRVEVGVRLYHAGKVQALLLTGDNHLVTYNEPEAMRQYALQQGVPDSAIVLDYAGFSTYDSCYRARDIFKVEQAILVTQEFHLDRALLICKHLGLDAVGVAADFVRPQGYSSYSLFQSEIREFPATALAVFDLLRGDKPVFLGEPLPIVVDARNRMPSLKTAT